MSALHFCSASLEVRPCRFPRDPPRWLGGRGRPHALARAGLSSRSAQFSASGRHALLEHAQPFAKPSGRLMSRSPAHGCRPSALSALLGSRAKVPDGPQPRGHEAVKVKLERLHRALFEELDAMGLGLGPVAGLHEALQHVPHAVPRVAGGGCPHVACQGQSADHRGGALHANVHGQDLNAHGLHQDPSLLLVSGFQQPAALRGQVFLPHQGRPARQRVLVRGLVFHRQTHALWRWNTCVQEVIELLAALGPQLPELPVRRPLRLHRFRVRQKSILEKRQIY